MTGRVLLVDDEPGLRDAVQAYLEESGFTVDVAANAQIGLKKLGDNPPELIISDIMMPRVDGYAFLEQVRSQEAYKHVPFIFLTAKGLTTDRIQGYNAGVDAYLPKPFDPDELVAIATNLLEKSRNNPDTSTVARELAEIKKLINQLEKK